MADTDPDQLQASYLDQYSHPDVMQSYAPIATVASGQGKFAGDEAIDSYASQVGDLYEKQLTFKADPADIQKNRKKLEENLKTRAQTHVIGTMAKQIQDRGGVGPGSPEYIFRRSILFGPHIADYGRAKELEQAQENFEAAKATHEDYQAVARKFAEQGLKERGAVGQFADVLSSLPEQAAEVMLPGTPGGATMLGRGAGMIGRQAFTAPIRIGSAVQQMEAPTPTIGPNGLEWKEGQDPVDSWTKALAADTATQGIFGAVNPFNAQAGKNLLIKVGKGLANLTAATELSEGARKLLGTAPEGGPLWGLAQALKSGDKDQIEKAAVRALSSTAAMAVFETGLHLPERGSNQPTPRDVKQGIEQVIEHLAPEAPKAAEVTEAPKAPEPKAPEAAPKQTWRHTGTQFADHPEGTEFTAADGNKYTIRPKLGVGAITGQPYVKLNVHDAEGKLLLYGRFNREESGDISSAETKASDDLRTEGKTELRHSLINGLYDFMHEQASEPGHNLSGRLVPSDTRSEGGKAIWSRNALLKAQEGPKKAPPSPPEAPKGPEAAQAPEVTPTTQSEAEKWDRLRYIQAGLEPPAELGTIAGQPREAAEGAPAIPATTTEPGQPEATRPPPAPQRRHIRDVSKEEILGRVERDEGNLTDREKRVLNERLIWGTGFREIGQNEGMSHENARLDESRAIKKLGYEGTVDEHHAAAMGGQAIADVKAGKQIGVDQLHQVDPDGVKHNAAINEIGDAIQDIDDLMRKKNKLQLQGKWTPERQAEHDGEYQRLLGVANKAHEAVGVPATEPGPAPGETPVRPEAIGGVQPGAAGVETQPPPEAVAGPTQGGAQAPVAAAAGGQAGGNIVAPWAAQFTGGPLQTAAAVPKALQSALAPATVGAEAKTGAGILRQNLAEMARRQEITKAALAEGERLLEQQIVNAPDPQTRTQRFLAFTDPIEAGMLANLPPGQTEAALALRDQIDQRSKMLADRDILDHFNQNYLGHLWKDPANPKATPEELAARILGRRPLMGAESFRKRRTIPTFADGIAAGLEPADWNPIRMQSAKIREMDKSIMGHDVVKELGNHGMWVFRRLGDRAPAAWKQLDDKAATVFAPPQTEVREYFDQKQMTALEDFANSLGIDLKRPTTGPIGVSTGGPPPEIQTRFGTPEEVFAHELGHHLEQRYGLTPMTQAPATATELENLAGLRASGRHTSAEKAYMTAPQERIANLVAGYLHAPEVTKQIAPTSYAQLDALLQSWPELQAMRDIKPSLELGARDQMLRLAGPMLTGHYFTPEPVARLLENYLRPGLGGNPIYDAVRGLGNTMNQFQLGFSAFHAGFELMDAMSSSVALGAKELSRGQWLPGLKHIVTAPIAPIRNLIEGNRILKEYYKPGSQGAEVAQIVDALQQAGGRARMDAFYNNDHLAGFIKDLDRLKAGQPSALPGAIGRGMLAVPEVVNKPTLEWMVPRMKLGVFADMARSEIAKLGPGASTEQLREVLGRSWDSVENRLGQLTYDNLFWNRAGKDLAMVMVRSVGWNLGTLRELGGGIKDIPASMKGLVKGEGITDRTAYALIGLPIVTGLIGGIYHYLATGKPPEDLKDYFAPKTGATTYPQGEAERALLPSYMKDVMHLANRGGEGPMRLVQNIGEMGQGKIHPAVMTAKEMIMGKDFFNDPIRNADDPWVKQTLDTVKHGFGSLEPFAFRKPFGGGELTKSQRVQQFFGITPAPAYIRRSDKEQLEREMRRRRK